MTDNVTADQLRQYIERAERLLEERQGISDDIRDVYPKAMREVIKLRKMERQKRLEEAAVLDTYKAALNID